MTLPLKGGRCSWTTAVEIREAAKGLAWMSLVLGRNVALDFAEFLFKSIQTGLDRLLLCDVGCQQSVQESLVGNPGVARQCLQCLEAIRVEIDGDGHPVLF